MLQRLQNIKSKLDVTYLQKHAKNHDRLMSSICQLDHLPSAFYKPDLRRSKTPLIVRPNSRTHHSGFSSNQPLSQSRKSVPKDSKAYIES